jgi:hypothetical protein
MDRDGMSNTLQVGIHILIFFLANLAKGNMSFCHHLVSVVCHLLTFHLKQELPVAAMFVNGSGWNEQSL